MINAEIGEARGLWLQLAGASGPVQEVPGGFREGGVHADTWGARDRRRAGRGALWRQSSGKARASVPTCAGGLLWARCFLLKFSRWVCAPMLYVLPEGREFYSLNDVSLFVLLECNSADHIKSQDSQHTPHSMTPSNAAAPRPSTPSHGQTTAPEPTPAQKTPAKVVYVFSTEMANR